MPSFECLYFLENFSMQIIEIMRTDLPEDAEVNKKFKWLKFDKESYQISQLDFSSMDSSGEIEERYFEQGYLKFNSTTGTFIEKFNSAQHPLDRRMEFRISTVLQNAIIAFINS